MGVSTVDLGPVGWTLHDAAALCRRIESPLRHVGYYAAISGGVINKDGPRPDLDLAILERCMASRKAGDREALIQTLMQLGFIISPPFDGFIVKATWQKKPVDLRIVNI